MKILDLRSDTFTVPGQAMRQAIAEAPVGDDVFMEDPTVNQLQEKAAELTGKEAALFVSSGTMGNLLALYLLGGRGNEVLMHEKAHTLHYELTGPAAIAGCLPLGVPGKRGILTPEALKKALKKNGPYYMAETSLVVIENTHNFAGGTCYSLSELQAVQQFCQEHQLASHMDGARVFNAALATGIPVKEIASFTDTITFCLSKGLGAPAGSLLCGSAAFIKEARKIRKMLGGGMRQAGILAAGGLYALEHNVDRLREDHSMARAAAKTLASLPWAELDPEAVESNIVFAQTRGISGHQAAEKLKQQGLLVIPTGEKQIRLVFSKLCPASEKTTLLQRLNAAGS